MDMEYVGEMDTLGELTREERENFMVGARGSIVKIVAGDNILVLGEEM